MNMEEKYISVSVEEIEKDKWNEEVVDKINPDDLYVKPTSNTRNIFFALTRNKMQKMLRQNLHNWCTKLAKAMCKIEKMVCRIKNHLIKDNLSGKIYTKGLDKLFFAALGSYAHFETGFFHFDTGFC